LVLITNIFLV